MNILYLCDEYPPGRHGGIGTAVQLLAREMVVQGHNVFVAGFYDWGYGGEDEYTDEGVKVFRFRRRLHSNLFSKRDSLWVRVAYRLLKDTGFFQRDISRSLSDYGIFLETLIKKNKIELVEMPDFCDYMNFCKSYVPFPRLSVPVVVKLHGSMTYIAGENGKKTARHIWQMEHDIVNQATAVTSVSKYNAEKTREYLSYSKNVTVLYNGIKIPDININIKKQENRVIYTGSLTENKGVYQLIKAWNLVNVQVPNAELHMFGKGPVSKIEKLLTPGALKKVFFNGHVSRSQLFQELSKSAIAVFPSYAESFAMAPMEAMAFGTAVIYTKLSSGPELIEDGVNGLLTDPYNVEDIAKKIVLLLSNRPFREKLGKAGMKHVDDSFDISVIARNNFLFYSTIVK